MAAARHSLQDLPGAVVVIPDRLVYAALPENSNVPSTQVRRSARVVTSVSPQHVTIAFLAGFAGRIRVTWGVTPASGPPPSKPYPHLGSTLRPIAAARRGDGCAGRSPALPSPAARRALHAEASTRGLERPHDSL